MYKSKVFIFLLSLMTMGSCYYDIEEELYPNVECESINITYKETILSIMKENCLGCHSATAKQGNVNLEGYNNVKKYVDNKRLMGTIKHESGYSPMPKGGGKLAACDIQKLEEWIKAGYPNN